MIEINRTDLQVLFDLAVNSMDFGSGFMDHEEVLVLRRFAVTLGVDVMTATPNNFVASFAHDFRASVKPPTMAPQFWSKSRELKCEWCHLFEDRPVHHGVSLTTPTTNYETEKR